MQESSINVFCYIHNNSFATRRNNTEVVCKAGRDIHVVGDDFTNEARWMYCCECDHYWLVEQGRRDYIKFCPSCGASDRRHYYTCDSCGVTMMDFSRAYCRKSFRILPWGQPHPYCAGCDQVQKGIPQTHYCPTLRGMLTSAYADCPFCGVEFEAASHGRLAKQLDIHQDISQTDRITYRSSSQMLSPYGGKKSVMEIEFDMNLARARAILAEVEAMKREAVRGLVSLV